MDRRLVKAPTGQICTHPPQNSQSNSWLVKCLISVIVPRPAGASALTSITSSQYRTQRRHWTHRFICVSINGLKYSFWNTRLTSMNRLVVGVYSCEKSCRSQRPPWSQTGQSSGWLARINSSTDLCAWVTTGVAVRTTMPSATGVLQEVCNFGVFSISTKHMRQLASHFSLGW